MAPAETSLLLSDPAVRLPGVAVGVAPAETSLLFSETVVTVPGAAELDAPVRGVPAGRVAEEPVERQLNSTTVVVTVTVAGASVASR